MCTFHPCIKHYGGPAMNYHKYVAASWFISYPYITYRDGLTAYYYPYWRGCYMYIISAYLTTRQPHLVLPKMFGGPLLHTLSLHTTLGWPKYAFPQILGGPPHAYPVIFSNILHGHSVPFSLFPVGHCIFNYIRFWLFHSNFIHKMECLFHIL